MRPSRTQPQQLERLIAGLYELEQRGGGPAPHLRIPVRRRLEELEQLPKALLRVPVESLVLRGVVEALAQQPHRGIELALLALVHDDPEHLPHVLHALEVIALIAEDVGELDDAPALQLFEAGADIRPRDAERLDDVVSVEGMWRDVQEGVHLGDAAADAPLRAHLAPVQDEPLLDGRQLPCHILYILLFLNIQKLQICCQPPMVTAMRTIPSTTRIATPPAAKRIHF